VALSMRTPEALGSAVCSRDARKWPVLGTYIRSHRLRWLHLAEEPMLVSYSAGVRVIQHCSEAVRGFLESRMLGPFPAPGTHRCPYCGRSSARLSTARLLRSIGVVALRLPVRSDVGPSTVPAALPKPRARKRPRVVGTSRGTLGPRRSAVSNAPSVLRFVSVRGVDLLRGAPRPGLQVCSIV